MCKYVQSASKKKKNTICLKFNNMIENYVRKW